jgi:Ca2+-binding EF-hand superfamily protein
MLVSTQELVNTIRQVQKVSNQGVDAQVWEVINQFDHDKDGFIDADEILKVNKQSLRYFIYLTSL